MANRRRLMSARGLPKIKPWKYKLILNTAYVIAKCGDEVGHFWKLYEYSLKNRI